MNNRGDNHSESFWRDLRNMQALQADQVGYWLLIKTPNLLPIADERPRPVNRARIFRFAEFNIQFRRYDCRHS